MAGNLYSSNFAPVASPATAAWDIWEITAPSDAVIVVHGFFVFQTSDLGDAAEEVVSLFTQRQTAAGTSGSVSSGTIVTGPLNNGMAATGATVEGFNTTVATNNLTVLERFGWNVRVPLQIWYTPETRPIIAPGMRWLLSSAGQADALTVGATIWFEEIGG